MALYKFRIIIIIIIIIIIVVVVVVVIRTPYFSSFSFFIHSK